MRRRIDRSVRCPVGECCLAQWHQGPHISRGSGGRRPAAFEAQPDSLDAWAEADAADREDALEAMARIGRPR